MVRQSFNPRLPMHSPSTLALQIAGHLERMRAVSERSERWTRHERRDVVQVCSNMFGICVILRT